MAVKDSIGFYYMDSLPGGALGTGLDKQIVTAQRDSNRIAVFKFGSNSDVDTVSEEDVWSNGGLQSYLTSGEIVNIQSTDAADTMDVVITGVNESWELTKETVTLNGTTPVSTVNQYLRIWRAQIADDAAVVNAGVITGAAAVSASVQFHIPAEDGQTSTANFTVPLGYTGFIYSLFGSTSPGDTAEIKTLTSRSGSAFRVGASLEVSGEFTARYFEEYPLSFEEKEDIRFLAKALNQNTRVFVSYQIILVKNEMLNGV